MTKYWNARRVQRVRQRKIKAEARATERAKFLHHQKRTYTRGDSQKNANLMLEALGFQLRRSMVARLRDGGAMSLSKLAKPYRITLPSALEHIRILERSGIITTHKRGRIRFCVYNPAALKELGNWLISGKLK